MGMCASAGVDTWSKIVKERWRSPEFVIDKLRECQVCACAGVLLYPQISGQCTVHIFSNADHKFFVAAVRAVKSLDANADMLSVYDKMRVYGVDEPVTLAGMYNFPQSKTGALLDISRLKKLVAWMVKNKRVGL